MTSEKRSGNQVKGVFCLSLAALIWGGAFVAQRVGLDYMGPFGLNAVRNLIGAAVLLPVIAVMKKSSGKRSGADRISSLSSTDIDPELRRAGRKNLLKGGLVCGTLLCIAGNFQQVGLKYTTVGKAGFITALYIVAVPILGLAAGKKTSIRIWISVAAAVTGLYLLCITECLTIGGGDLLELICAIAFAFQILAVDHYSRITDGTMLACAEFAVCGVLTLIPMLLTETLTPEMIWQARIPLLYAGVLSSGVAYTMQIIGQKELRPTIASLIMSLEAVISALAGWLILGQRLSPRELCGCAIMFAAIILAQI